MKMSVYHYISERFGPLLSRINYIRSLLLPGELIPDVMEFCHTKIGWFSAEETLRLIKWVSATQGTYDMSDLFAVLGVESYYGIEHADTFATEDRLITSTLSNMYPKLTLIKEVDIKGVYDNVTSLSISQSIKTSEMMHSFPNLIELSCDGIEVDTHQPLGLVKIFCIHTQKSSDFVSFPNLTHLWILDELVYDVPLYIDYIKATRMAFYPNEFTMSKVVWIYNVPSFPSSPSLFNVIRITNEDPFSDKEWMENKKRGSSLVELCEKSTTLSHLGPASIVNAVKNIFTMVGLSLEMNGYDE
jgi:hypothetical protein